LNLSGLKGFVFKIITLAAMLLGLPLLGIVLAGYPVYRYLEFPPKTLYVQHASFSWIAFFLYFLLIFAVITPVVVKTIRPLQFVKSKTSPVGFFPWWGWLGAATGVAAWILAWTRFSWFTAIQPHTFTPLWIAYILVVNALAHRRTGHCMLMDSPGYFLLLFPTSALFWWFFEYLNRFVQNWLYQGVSFTSLEYFWYATLPFSTVLPAVLGTRELILQTGWIQRTYKQFWSLNCSRPKILALSTLAISALGLAGIGVWPNYLFGLLWVSPLLIIVCLQALLREHHLLTDMARGDWRLAVASVLAALICGWFWEMWNYYSFAKWVYRIPFVHRFQIFEMPVLGYAGYLPFGLECSVIGGMLARLRRSWQNSLGR
jgi:hypothetical protein